MSKKCIEKTENAALQGISCEVSVFLALITLLVASLILSSVELLRTQAAKTYLTVAADSAMDSLFSQYHLELWETYRLFGMEMYSEEEITGEYNTFLEPYMSTKETRNWYGLSKEQDGVEISEYVLMTDGNGAVFEQEVMDYMQYGWTMDAARKTAVQEAAEQIESSVSTDKISGELEDCSDSALALQKKLNALSDEVSEHNAESAELRQALSEGNGTRAGALILKLRRSLSRIKDSVEDIRRCAGKLKEKTQSAGNDIESRYREGKLTEENYRQLSGQLDNYTAYSDECSEQSEELEELSEDILSDELCLEQVEKAAEEAGDYIRNWVPEQILVRYDPPEEEGGEPVPVYEEEELDEAAVWEDTKELFEAYEELSFSAGNRAADEERAGQLNTVKSLLSGNLLQLVLPDAGKISRTERDLKTAPSIMYCREEDEPLQDTETLLNTAGVTEYAMTELTHLRSGTDSFGRPELEYVLCGCRSDYQNVSATVTELIGVRTGLNLTYLLADKDAYVQAGQLAAAVTGAAAGTPLVFVVTFLILSVWAAGQAVLDVRKLLDGGKVPLMHSKKTFTLSLSGLLNGSVEVPGRKHSDEQGLSYAGYLRMLLYTRPRSRTDYRIMDVIQENMREEQKDFRMDRLYTALDLSVSAGARHVFITPDVLSGKDYRLSVHTYYAYSG